MTWLCGAYLNVFDEVRFHCRATDTLRIGMATDTSPARTHGVVAVSVRPGQTVSVTRPHSSTNRIDLMTHPLSGVLVAEGQWPEIWDVFLAHTRMLT